MACGTWRARMHAMTSSIYIHTQDEGNHNTNLVAEAHVDVGVGVPHAVLRLLVPEPEVVCVIGA